MTRTVHSSVLAIVLAGGPGTRLEALTEARPKPVLPFAGVYRLIDFPLSNCRNSEVADVWVVEQYRPRSLGDHLANGRPWDLDRTRGGLQLLPPRPGSGEEDHFYAGTADALYQNLDYLRDANADRVLVLSSDHLYKLDYRDVLARHDEARAAATFVTTVEEEAGRFGVVEVDDNGGVRTYVRKPDEPPTNTVTTEVFCFDRGALTETLEACAADEEDMEDLGDAVLPRLVEERTVVAHPLDGYWRDVGTIHAYWDAHMELLRSDVGIHLDDPAWPILTAGLRRPPAHVHEDAQVDDVLLSPGVSVRGTVQNAVLGPGVVVAEGATVRDSVLLEDAEVAEGATVRGTILDADVRVESLAHVGGDPTQGITQVGRGLTVEQGQQVGPGQRLDPSG